MNNDLLEHRGYYGSVQYSAEDDCLIGKVEFIDDLILFNAEDVPSLKAAFVEAVFHFRRPACGQLLERGHIQVAVVEIAL